MLRFALLILVREGHIIGQNGDLLKITNALYNKTDGIFGRDRYLVYQVRWILRRH